MKKTIITVIQLITYLFLLTPIAAQSEQFSIVVIPDTQIYVEENPEIFEAQMNWVVANRDAENIIYVAHLGDLKDDRLCDDKTITDLNGLVRTEWEIVDDTLAILENANIAYGVVPGNHDFDQIVTDTRTGPRCPTWGTERPLVDFNDYVGPTRFTDLNQPYYGDPVAGIAGNRVAGSNEDNFTLFQSSGGVKFISINLAYKEAANALGDDAEVSWADDLLKAYPNRLGIITSHFFLDDNNRFAPYGQEVYDGLQNNPNLIMMLSAHKRGEAWRIEDRSDNDMQVVQVLLSDYQSSGYPPADFGAAVPYCGSSCGDSGLMRIMRFDTDTGLINVKTFTPPVPLLSGRDDTLVSNYFPSNGAAMGRDTASNFSFSFEGYVPPPPEPSTTWTGNGEGTVLVQDGSSSDPSLDYSLSGTSVFSTKTWTLSSTANVTNSITLPYSYTGYHAWFQVEVFLEAYITRDGVTTVTPLVNDGPINCCTAPSGGFAYEGSVTLDVQLGDTYGFRFGGRNFDSDSRLQGLFTIPFAQ